MDPLAGATLAETRLKDLTPFSAPALILGANAPLRELRRASAETLAPTALQLRQRLAHRGRTHIPSPVAPIAPLEQLAGQSRMRKPTIPQGPPQPVLCLWHQHVEPDSPSSRHTGTDFLM